MRSEGDGETGQDDGPPEIDAAVVADAFGLETSEVRRLMRAGTITGKVYRGVDDDAGTWLCHLFHGNGRLTVVMADDGRVIRRSTIDFGDRPLPPSLRRP